MFWAYLKASVFGYFLKMGVLGLSERGYFRLFFRKFVFWAYLKASVFGFFLEASLSAIFQENNVT